MAKITALHIPHKTWAITRDYSQLYANLLAIWRWATTVTCRGGGQLFPASEHRFRFPYLDSVRSDRDGGLLESNYLALERFSSLTCHQLRVPFKQWLRVNPLDPHGRDWELANLAAIEAWASSLHTCCASLYATFDVQTLNYPTEFPILGSGVSTAYVLPRDVDFTHSTSAPGTRGFRLNTQGSAGGLTTTWQLKLNGVVVSEGNTSPFGGLFSFNDIDQDGVAGQTLRIVALDNGLESGYYPAIQAVVFGVVEAPSISEVLPFLHDSYDTNLYTDNYNNVPALGPHWGTATHTLVHDYLLTEMRLRTSQNPFLYLSTWQVLLDGIVICEGQNPPHTNDELGYPIDATAGVAYAGQTVQIRALDYVLDVNPYVECHLFATAGRAYGVVNVPFDPGV